jgi:hypothetical protein
MILNDPAGRAYAAGKSGGLTLDDLFRRAAARQPDAVALADSPDRERFADGPPRRLTYAQADQMVWAIAGRLHRLGLNSDAIVGLQFANTVESAITLLAVLRAGLIAMPLPLLWRRADMAAALQRVGASALIVSGRVGRVDHFELALQAAAEVFPIRCVCGFGRDAPDGVVALDDLYAAETLDPVPPVGRERAAPPGPGAHVAAITWDVTTDGLVPVARSHSELIAGGRAVLLEGGFRPDAVIVTTVLVSSFAGIAATLLPWLATGGTLAFHHPFDSKIFAAQLRTQHCDSVIMPGPLVAGFGEAGILSAAHGLRTIIALWRAPEKLATAPRWPDAGIGMTDVQVFGEAGLIAARRQEDGLPAAILFGTMAAERGSTGTASSGEVRRSARGTVALRGPMVPRFPFPPGAERMALPQLAIAADGLVDTGYACQPGRETLSVSGPPPGLISVGGYRFAARALQEAVADIGKSVTLAALPDAFLGQRLAAAAIDRTQVATTLAGRGAHALVVGAFGGRRHHVT